MSSIYITSCTETDITVNLLLHYVNFSWAHIHFSFWNNDFLWQRREWNNMGHRGGTFESSVFHIAVHSVVKGDRCGVGTEELLTRA